MLIRLSHCLIVFRYLCNTNPRLLGHLAVLTRDAHVSAGACYMGLCCDQLWLLHLKVILNREPCGQSQVMTMAHCVTCSGAKKKKITLYFQCGVSMFCTIPAPLPLKVHSLYPFSCFHIENVGNCAHCCLCLKQKPPLLKRVPFST